MFILSLSFPYIFLNILPKSQSTRDNAKFAPVIIQPCGVNNAPPAIIASHNVPTICFILLSPIVLSINTFPIAVSTKRIIALALLFKIFSGISVKFSAIL